MMKWSFMLMLLASFSACEKDPTNPTNACPNVQSECSTSPVETDPVPVPSTGGDNTPGENPTTPPPTTTTPPAQALTWDADIYMVNFSAVQEAKVSKAIALIKKVIQSEEFRTRILNYTYNGKKAFFDNGGFSNAQIYQKILDGAETMNGNKNNTMDVELELYYQATTTIGYTYPDTTRIWMNTKYFDKYTPVEVSDNLIHEWLHKLGFSHSASYTAARDHSVPYAIGYLMEELAAKIK